MSDTSPRMRRKTTVGPTGAPALRPQRTSLAAISHTSMDSSHRPSQGQGFVPSFYSIMATKRIAHAFASRFRRTSSRFMLGSMSERSSRMGMGGPQQPKEPTYRMEPKRKFNSSQVEAVLKEVIDRKLVCFKYDPVSCPAMSKSISDEVKDKVKKLRFDRYKIVCLVTMGEKRNQGLRVTSRCTWDTGVDNSSSYNWENSDYFCSATVYGVYHE